jgi:RNA polymerase sigma-70 factor, ECF subfamily
MDHFRPTRSFSRAGVIRANPHPVSGDMGVARPSVSDGVIEATLHAARVSRLRTAEQGATLPPNAELCTLLNSIAVDRDRQAFAVLFGCLAPRVKSFLMRYGEPDALAEELAQDTLLTVWRKADRFDPSRAAVSTWVFTIARNKRIDRLRRDRGGPPRPDASDERDDCASSEDFAIATEREDQVRTALAKLPPDQAEVVRLSFFAEKPHAEIASELRIPLGTVKSRARLALGRLRALLEGEL